MIDHELRSQGIGASEIAAVVGIDHRRSAFDVYAEKVGLIQRTPPTPRMRWGKMLERVIAEAYAAETGRTVEWFDKTLVSRERSWQVFSPDAFVLNDAGERMGGADCKNVSWDQWEHWGEPGTDAVPESIALQCQWTCSGADLPWWHVAALRGGNDLCVYELHRDPEIEAVLLEEGYRFWHENVLKRVPPPIESTDAAREYLRQRYPRNVSVIRPATDEERSLITQYREASERFEESKDLKETLQLRICELIGEADGITFPVPAFGKAGRIMWKLGQDVHVDAHVRKASRRFDCRIVKAT